METFQAEIIMGTSKSHHKVPAWGRKPWGHRDLLQALQWEPEFKRPTLKQPHQRGGGKVGYRKKKVRIGLSCGAFPLGRVGRLTKECYLRLSLACPFITTSKAPVVLRRKSQLLNWA